MTLRKSVTVRNAQNNALEAAIGPSPVLKIRSGAAPARTSDPDSGELLATLPLPADWMLPSNSGTMRMSGEWKTTAGAAAGTAGHFRLYSSTGTCHLQGTISLAETLPVGDLVLDKVALLAGDPVQVINFAITAGNG